jgi:multidrug resistance efflux pump
LVVTAPQAGVVLEQVAYAGELAAPGATLLRMGDLDHVTLTVYLPVANAGRVRVGQPAVVRVDAYPGEEFQGTVSYLAPEAEFTPKNVQTRQERSDLVYAVKIALDNPEHRLKPGMPAEAEITP